MDTALALVPGTPHRIGGAVPDHQCLTFVSSGTHFGVDIAVVKEIIQFNGVTEVPMMPSCIRGVINLRGLVVPVVDLAVRFDREPSTIGRRTCVVIIELIDGVDRQDIGVLVDAVSEVVDVPGSDVMPAPGFGTSVRADFIRGMAKRDEGFVILLEIGATFDSHELARLTPTPTDLN